MKRGRMDIRFVDSPFEVTLNGLAKTHDPAKSYGDELIKIYGHWTDDPSKLEMELLYALE